MTSFSEVRDTVTRSIARVLPDHNVYQYQPRSIIPPCIILEPSPHNTIDYEQTYSSGVADWNFTVKIVVGQVDEQWAQDKVAEHISPNSDLIRAIQAVEFGDGPGHGWARVWRGGISQMMFGKALYTYAELSVRATT